MSRTTQTKSDPGAMRVQLGTRIAYAWGGFTKTADGARYRGPKMCACELVAERKCR